MLSKLQTYSKLMSASLNPAGHMLAGLGQSNSACISSRISGKVSQATVDFAAAIRHQGLAYIGASLPLQALLATIKLQ
jgi:hypothetical protein